MGMGVDLSILYFWRQYALVFARMFLGMPECWLSYSRAEQYPGSCSRSSEGRPRLLHTSSPWREGFPRFPVTAAVHQEGCHQAVRKPFPVLKCPLAQKPSISIIPCFSEGLCGPQLTGTSYFGLGNDLAINLGRNPSRLICSTLKGLQWDIWTSWQSCRRSSAEHVWLLSCTMINMADKENQRQTNPNAPHLLDTYSPFAKVYQTNKHGINISI